MNTWEIDLSEREIDTLEVVSVFSSCVTKLNIIEGLKKMNLKQMVQHIYQLQSFTMNTLPDYGKSILHEISIEGHLSKCGLVRVSSPKDGDCFFHSIASNIIHAPETWRCVLESAGVLQSNSKDLPGNLSLRLRQLFVLEITGERQHNYKEFIIGDTDHCVLAQKFLAAGYFNSQLGDLMPLAMSTALQCYIVIFRTGRNNHLYVSPHSTQLKAEGRTIFWYTIRKEQDITMQ